MYMYSLYGHSGHPLDTWTIKDLTYTSPGLSKVHHEYSGTSIPKVQVFIINFERFHCT